MHRFLRLLPLLLALAACAPQPVERPPVEADPAAPAYQALAEGRYREAAQRFEALAAGADGDRAARLWLEAAEAYLLGGQREQARRVLGELPPALPPEPALRRQLTETELILRQEPEEALAMLRAPAADTAPRELFARFHQLRAEAYALIGNALEEAQEYLLRERYLDRTEAIEANQRALWQALAALPEPLLQRLREETGSELLRGWIDLVALGKDLSGARGAERVSEWRARYPSHPAREAFLEALLEQAHELTRRPGHIALLLPMSGRFANAGAAVLDGVAAAWYATPETERPVLRVYDMGEDPRNVFERYNEAVENGAEMVIGPLNKEAVRALARYESLPVPTLALNYAEPPANQQLFQFALSPEEEARQVAERAWFDGFEHATALVPDSEWGARVLEAFTEHWQLLGGTLLDEARYDPEQSDFSTPIQNLLNLTDSEARRTRLARMIGERPEFEPRRRQDVEFVFVAAFPRQARLIKPQLRFFHAISVPVYATSHAFSGAADAAQDRDMDGILFGDMPWTLDADTPGALIREDNTGALAGYGGSLQRLAAMGVDSYRLVTRLKLLQRFAHDRFVGETGTLSVNEENRVQRELLWARFRNGVPQVVETRLVGPVNER